MEGTEVGNLIVRLTGDGANYQNMLSSAVSAAEGVATKLAKVGAAVSLAVSAPFIALRAAALHAFAGAEMGEIKLRAVLQANERQVDSTMSRYKSFALEMQRTTTAEDDAVLATFRLAETFDLTGDAAERAVKEAYALGTAAEISSDAAMRLTAAMAKGDVETAMLFSRMVKQLRGVRDETKFVERYNKLITQGMAQAKAEATSYSGSMMQLKNDMGNLLETLGEFVARGWKPFIQYARQAIAVVQDFSPAMQQTVATITSLLATIGPAIAGLGMFALGLTSIITLCGYLPGALAAVGAAFVSMKIWAGASFLTLTSLGGGVIAVLGAIKLAAVAAAAYGIYRMTTAIYDFNPAIVASNKAVKEAIALDDEWSRRHIDRTANILNMITMHGDNTAEAKRAADAAVGPAKDAVDSYAKHLEKVKMQLQEIDGFWKRAVGHKGLKAARGEVETWEGKLALAQDRLAQIERVRDALPKSQTRKDVMKELDEFNKSLEKQIFTLGLTPGQAKLVELGILGIAEAEEAMREAMSRVKYIDVATKQMEVEKSSKDMEKQLQIELDTWGKTADEVALYKMQLDGLTGARDDSIQAMVKEKKEMGEYFAKQARGRQIAEELLTPLDKYIRKTVDLEEARQMGAFGFGEQAQKMHDRGLLQAQREFEGAAMPTVAPYRYQEIRAAEFGSVEASARVAKSLAMQGTSDDSLEKRSVKSLEEIADIARKHWKGDPLAVVPANF